MAVDAAAARSGPDQCGDGPEDMPIVILRSQDVVRRWLKEDQGRSIDAAGDFERLPARQALALRHDDPELATVVQRAVSFGLLIFEAEEIEVDPVVRDLLPAPISRRLGVLPLVASGQWLDVLMSDVEAGHTVEFMVRQRVVPILARPNLIARGLGNQYDCTEDEAMIQYCSDTDQECGQMPLVERLAAVSDAIGVQFSLDASGVESAATADAAAARDLVEKRIAPRFQPLRGEVPQLAAFFV